MLNVKKTLTKLMNNLPFLAVESKSTGSFTIAANNTAETSLSVAKTGYTPLAVVGFNLQGSGVSFCTPYHIYLSGSSVYYAFRNYSNGQASVSSASFYVLYLKLGGGYSLTALFNAFSRLAERRWEYAESEETEHENVNGTERPDATDGSERGMHSIPSGRPANRADRLSIGMACDTLGKRQTFSGCFCDREGIQRFELCGLPDKYKHSRRNQSSRPLGWHNIRSAVRIFEAKNSDIFRGLTPERGWSCA